MDKVRLGLEIYKNYNCAQSSFIPFSRALNLDDDFAIKICSGFGGGLGKSEVCGVVTGITMAIGLKFGDDSENGKELVKTKVKQFTDRFIKVNGSLTCRGLLGYDKSTEDGKRVVEELDLCNKLCPGFVKSSIELGEEIIS